MILLAFIHWKKCHLTSLLAESDSLSLAGNDNSTLYSRRITSNVHERYGTISALFICPSSSKSISVNKVWCSKGLLAIWLASYDICIISLIFLYLPFILAPTTLSLKISFIFQSSEHSQKTIVTNIDFDEELLFTSTTRQHRHLTIPKKALVQNFSKPPVISVSIALATTISLSTFARAMTFSVLRPFISLHINSIALSIPFKVSLLTWHLNMFSPPSCSFPITFLFLLVTYIIRCSCPFSVISNQKITLLYFQYQHQLYHKFEQFQKTPHYQYFFRIYDM